MHSAKILVAGMFLLGGSGLLSYLLGRSCCLRKRGLPVLMGLLGCIAGCMVALAGTVFGLCKGGGSLATLFQLPIVIVGACAALHARGYLKGHCHDREGLFWLLFNGMLACMLQVTAANSFLPFLVSWELMGIFSFGLVAFEWHEQESAGASWGYLLACQAGGMLLMLMHAFGANSALPMAALVLGVVGFGLKIGLPGLHTWLPEAHPAAPAPVSAVMSGAMIPLGFYGVLRWALLPLTGKAPELLGWILAICGAAVIVPAAILALAQGNLKRLLAYSSVENMGIVAMGVGLGILGFAYGDNTMGVVALSGAMLHLLNHALLKGSLFLGAGSLLRATGTLELDKMGGLMRRMPQTGGLFTLSALSLGGLPPFNGFLGEFLIYWGAFLGIIHCSELGNSAWMLILCVVVVLALALTGGLAAAAYARAIGGAFLGEPRRPNAEEAQEVAPSMRSAMWILTGFSLAVLVAAPWLCRLLLPAVLNALTLPAAAEEMTAAMSVLAKVSIASAVFIAVTAAICLWRRLLPRGKETPIRPTWDCGYARPTARMEYTSTALVQPLMDYFAPMLRLTRRQQPPEGHFPEHASVTIKSDDPASWLLWRPLRRALWRIADVVHRFQSGYLHLYVLVMVVALLALLVWGWLDGIDLSKGGVAK